MVGKKSREKQQRRAVPKPPPVGKQQPSLWRTSRVRITALANESLLAGLQTGPPPWPAEHAKLAVRPDHLGRRPLRTVVLRKFAWNRQLVVELWLLVAYLLVLYAALRWGAGSPDRYPGSD